MGHTKMKTIDMANGGTLVYASSPILSNKKTTGEKKIKVYQLIKDKPKFLMEIDGESKISDKDLIRVHLEIFRDEGEIAFSGDAANFKLIKL